MNRALPFFLIKTIIIVNKCQNLSAFIPQYTLEANRSKGSWVILGHPNKQTDKQTSRDYYFIYIDVNLAKVLFGSCSVLSPSQIPPRTWSRWRLFSSLYSFLVEMGAFNFFQFVRYSFHNDLFRFCSSEEKNYFVGFSESSFIFNLFCSFS